MDDAASGAAEGREPDREWLARDFEAHRAHLRAVAYRVLGSAGDADDAVQEAWLRLSRQDVDDIVNLGGWLTTVVSRVSLDMLRSRTTRREHDWDAGLADLVGPDSPAPAAAAGADPADEAELADAVGTALLVVLDTLTPAERLAFVLHDLFGLPFEQIADVVDRSPAATRQLASRARRRVRRADVDLDGERHALEPAPGADADPSHQRRVVSAFLDAARGGDLVRLLELLDPEVVLRSDAAAAALGSPSEVRGAEAVAAVFDGRTRAARMAAFDGGVGAVWTHRGRLRVAFAFSIEGERIVGLRLIGDEEWLAGLTVDYLAR